jgi:uncharacterized protein (DUF305 family)/uncharacterized cupredoxin-like copper-binding protein
MKRIPCLSIVTAVLATILVFVAVPANLTAAQTPAVDHEQHHPGTPAADTAANDPCVAVATPSADIPHAGMMPGTPPMGGDMTEMMGQFDLMFIDMMVPHHASAVAMAQVAETRAEHPELRALAEQIIASQRAEIAQMQTWREAWFPDAPAMPMMPVEQMMEMMNGMMGEMPGGMMGTPGAMPGPGEMGVGMMLDMEQEIARLCATTEGFDLAFIEAMIPHHQMAVMMAQVATMRAEHPELQALAQTMNDDQQREIAQMQAWRTAWSAAATPEMATSGHDAATTAASEQTGTEQIAVTLTEFSIELASTTLHAGRPYTFVVTNDGTVPHEFVIERLGATHEPLVDGDQTAMVTGIAPGETRTLGWTFTEAGSYQLACHEPGHYEAGQVLAVDVTG